MEERSDQGPEDEHGERTRRRALLVAPAAALGVGLLLTVVFRFLAGDLVEESVRDRFDDRAHGAMAATEAEVRAYLDELRDIGNYATIDAAVEPARFRALVELSGLLDEVPGEQAIGYLERQPTDPAPVLIAVAADVPGVGDEVVTLTAPATLEALASLTVAPVLAGVVDLDALAAELGATADPLLAGFVEDLGATYAASDGGPSRFVPAIAVPVGDGAGPPRGFLLAELLPRELVAPVPTDDPDAPLVSVALLRGTTSIPLVEVPEVGDLATGETFRLAGLDWSLHAVAPAGFGDAAIASAQRIGTIAGLVLTVALVALVFFRGRVTLTTRDIRQELGATQVEARRDPLTGLVNRAGFMENLEQAIDELDQAHRYVAVLFVDVDRLKVVNDSLGHSIGDLALVEIARRFSAIGRWSDTVARFGGDEFVLLCSGLQLPADAVRIAEEVLLSLAQPILVDEMELVMSASVGVAVASLASNTDAESLVRDADTAMYEAKAAGGNRIVPFDDGLRVKVTGRLHVERSLRAAVENGELDVHFQPIVDAATGAIVSAEALVRWFPEDGGMISPGVFMPVASETGMVVQIGDFVLQRSCLLASELEQMFPELPPISIAVNVAERQLLDPGLVNRVRQMTQAARIWPRQLTLEITEDVMIDRLGRSLEVLRRLADIGFGLAIDDFGTGMSSLSYVKRLDMVRYLKIDQSFVVDVARDPADRAIVSSVVAMARSLGVTVVAEGVQDPEQADVLRGLGVHRMQGFLWSEAIPAPEFRELVRTVMGPVAAAAS